MYTVFGAEHDCITDTTLGILLKLDYFDVAGIIIPENLGADLNTAHAESTVANIYIRLFHDRGTFIIVWDQS